jgi:hypothetical protein
MFALYQPDDGKGTDLQIPWFRIKSSEYGYGLIIEARARINLYTTHCTILCCLLPTVHTYRDLCGVSGNIRSFVFSWMIVIVLNDNFCSLLLMIMLVVGIDPGSFEYYGSTLIIGTWNLDLISSH